MKEDFNNNEPEELVIEPYEREQPETKKRNDKVKHKTSHKTKKKIVKKEKKSKPKEKVVYKYRDKKSHSGILTFLLLLIILGLVAVIGYLFYVNYYDKEDNSSTTVPITENKETEMCISKATKYNVSASLAKCPDSTKFKLVVVGTDLSFGVTRTNDKTLPYLINNIYYKEKLLSTPLTGTKVNENWRIKTIDDVSYILLEKGSDKAMQSLIALENGKLIYSGIDNEYKFTTDISFTKYTDLGLQEINSCEAYKTTNTEDNEMWSKGKIIYKDGTVTESIEETIYAKDVCTK